MNTRWNAGSLQTIRTPSLQAVLSLPPTSEESKRPLLCFLHGYDEAAPAEIRTAMMLHGPLHPAAPPEVTERFVILAPQLPKRGDLWHRYADGVHEFVERAQREYDADPARCYLTGFSFGGNGVFDLPLLRPGFWAALWSVDPTRLPAVELKEPVWLSIGDIVRRHADAFTERLQSQTPDVTLASDRVHLDQNEDHVGSARLAYADPQIYEWLLMRSRKPLG